LLASAGAAELTQVAIAAAHAIARRVMRWKVVIVVSLNDSTRRPAGD
jgi:hypothetical protein